jgi:hypothetical protein
MEMWCGSRMVFIGRWFDGARIHPSVTWLTRGLRYPTQVNEKAQQAEKDRHFDAKYEQMAYYLDKKVHMRCPHPSGRERAPRSLHAWLLSVSPLAGQVMALEQERIGIRKVIEEEMAAAWTAQPKQGRKEWDLSDPDTIKYDLPARVGDADPRNGPASVQQFSGEDLHAGERKKLQMAQQKAWCVERLTEGEGTPARNGLQCAG